MKKVSRMIWLIVLLASMPLGQLSEGRSILVKNHKLQKRAAITLEETCPPPYEFLNEECNDTCTDDDHCLGNNMCCYDGCAYSCMEPLPSIPVVDWLDFETGITDGGDHDGDEELYAIAEPIIEPSVCEYEGKTLDEGEGYTQGCYRCRCYSGNFMCEVGQCRNRVQARLFPDREVSGEGPEQSSGDEEFGARKETSGYSRNDFGDPSDDLEQKADSPARPDEESGFAVDDASSAEGFMAEGFMAYKSVKLKRMW